MKIDLGAYRDREAQGLITCRPHPTEPLLIWNYTPRCQFDKAWDEITMQARGFITTEDGTIVGRPFKKFFNLEEHTAALPSEPFKVYEKMDGSLFILCRHQDKLITATRGSFESEQAIDGTSILAEKYAHYPFASGFTYLFEYVAPANRIVVDYGNMRDLVLLAIVHTEGGYEIDIHKKMHRDNFPFPVAERYDGIRDFTKIKELEEPNREGFVIRFESGLRLKVKFEEYKRLHAILTETSSTVIWELLAVESIKRILPELDAKGVGDSVLTIDKRKIQPILDRQGKAMDSLIEQIPDEMHQWIKDLIGSMQAIHDEAIEKAQRVVEKATNRLDIITATKDDATTRAIAFSLLDNKLNIAHGLAWRLARPTFSKAFRTDIDQ